jgi:hypothetical protein
MYLMAFHQFLGMSVSSRSGNYALERFWHTN